MPRANTRRAASLPSGSAGPRGSLRTTLKDSFSTWGDMLVRSGDRKTRAKLYLIAQLSRAYARVTLSLSAHGTHPPARENVVVVNAAGFDSRTGLMVRSAFGCIACHQMRRPSSVGVPRGPQTRAPESERLRAERRQNLRPTARPSGRGASTSGTTLSGITLRGIEGLALK